MVHTTARLALEQERLSMGINWTEIFWAIVFYTMVSGLLAFVVGYLLKVGMRKRPKK